MRSIHVCALLFGLVAMALIAPGTSIATVIDFENGYDMQVISSSITGLEFTNTAGYDWLYGDWRTNGYNGKYPNYLIILNYPLATQYYSDGHFFAWMGTDQGMGIITFTQSYATYFQVGYSTYSGVTLQAFDENDQQLDTATGYSNVGTGRLDTLRVEAPGMAYVTIQGVNNQWLIDNLDTDAIQECTVDANCDDGDYCTGEETCVLYQCQSGTPVFCNDDGIFCNGTESCSSEAQACVHSGNPCQPDEQCDEVSHTCNAPQPDDDVDDDSGGLNFGSDDDDTSSHNVAEQWPKGKVTGGCCGA